LNISDVCGENFIKKFLYFCVLQNKRAIGKQLFSFQMRGIRGEQRGFRNLRDSIISCDGRVVTVRIGAVPVISQ